MPPIPYGLKGQARDDYLRSLGSKKQCKNYSCKDTENGPHWHDGHLISDRVVFPEIEVNQLIPTLETYEI